MKDTLVAQWHNFKNGVLMEVFKREDGTYYVTHIEEHFDISDAKMLRICGLWHDEALKVVKELDKIAT